VRAVAQEGVEFALQIGDVNGPDNAEGVETVLPGGLV
jgi:hypothetical protein